MLVPWYIEWRNPNGKIQAAVINARSHVDVRKRAKAMGCNSEILRSGKYRLIQEK